MNDGLSLSPKTHLKTWGLGVTVCNPSTGENTEGSLGLTSRTVWPNTGASDQCRDSVSKQYSRWCMRTNDLSLTSSFPMHISIHTPTHVCTFTHANTHACIHMCVHASAAYVCYIYVVLEIELGFIYMLGKSSASPAQHLSFLPSFFPS